MRAIRDAQSSIFDFYAEHDVGRQFKALSDLLDDRVELLDCVAQDFVKDGLKESGACGLSIESVFRCMLLKQILKVTYRQLEFLLCDSPTYRTFARLKAEQQPCYSGLNAAIRQIKPETLEKANQLLVADLLQSQTIGMNQMRIDSTVTESNIVSPSDSQLLADSIRVLSRLLIRSKKYTGVDSIFRSTQEI